MGWIEDQIKERKKLDEEMLSSSFLHLVSSVTGKRIFTNDFEVVQDSFDQILKFYHYPTNNKIPDKIDGFYAKLDYLCLKVGIVYREVKLTNNWFKDANGAFLAFKKDGDVPVALIPCVGGYKFLENGKYVHVNKKNQNMFDSQALCFYRSFPSKKLTLVDLIKFAFTSVHIRNFVGITFMLLITTLIGLITPKISYFLYGPVIEYSDTTLLLSTIVFSMCVTISTTLFSTFNTMYTSIVNTNISLSVEAATMQRVFSLKANFFRDYSSGELSSRTAYVSSLTSSLVNIIFSTTLSSLFSLIYIGSIFEYAPSLVVPSLIIILITIGFSLFTSFAGIRVSKKRMELAAKENGLTYSLISGIQKIRLAGAERRIFSKWANAYAEQAKLSYNPPFYLKYNTVISLIISLGGTIAMYFFSIQSGVSVAEYNAFNTAYAMVFGAFSSLSSIALSIASLKPTYELAKPILEAEPEKYDDKIQVTSLSGNIEISHVSFKYGEKLSTIFDDLNIKIKPGEYVAIVGKTGCGKSTLVRLLLGFETPNKGTVYYDGKDINTLNLKMLRRKIGIVMQGGKLFQGDIFSNIAVCAPDLTIDGAFEAADMAGIGNDIREMPMGMNTVVAEGGGGLSGGQRQRILIARAIAPKPKILIFDEATSTLDNITQRHVSEALGKLNCTRIVIAHRLSTIKNCDRIICLEKGKIAEEGTYDQLIEKNGMFADLVRHQLLDRGQEKDK